MSNDEQQRLQSSLLAWYDENGRDLPWRIRGGEADPYKVWLSEIMLQQTTVATVIPYYRNFVGQWPTLRALATADQDRVLHAWQGLGYYARARNLLKCARHLVADHGAAFPDSEAELLQLPGIGPYTAAAIAAIAFQRPSAPVDGNIRRVFARLFRLKTPPPGLDVKVAARLLEMAPHNRPGDFVQALMDLGSGVCTPTSPDCAACPWTADCAGHAAGVAENLPVKPPKKRKPTRRGVVFWAEDPDGGILLRRRPDKGLLGGMMEMPSTDWREDGWSVEEATAQAPLQTDWTALPDTVRHTFTHFHLELTVLTGRAGRTEGIWSAPDRLSEHALPTVMKKVARHVHKHA